MKPEMPSSDLLEVLEVLTEAAISVWLDGGWAVDALLEKQTRLHKDVDIIVQVADVPKLREILEHRGFALQEGLPPNSFVLADGAGLEVDVHAVMFDDEGNGVYQMQNGKKWIFPAEGFDGRGVIEGRRVRCLSATTQVLCHACGYVPAEKDFRDMELLAERFGVELPPQLQRGST
jgi:lincosamide nucleotidyltransferase A/C/D/E